jgi:hypothetical protein
MCVRQCRNPTGRGTYRELCGLQLGGDRCCRSAGWRGALRVPKGVRGAAPHMRAGGRGLHNRADGCGVDAGGDGQHGQLVLR